MATCVYHKNVATPKSQTSWTKNEIIKMKQIFTILAVFLTMNFSFGQALKTFNGQFNDGRLQSGNATYTYYEDPNNHEYLKQGAFKYTFKGQGEYLGFDQTITGNFEKGLKNGTWTYVITMTDFGKGNPYATGTVTLTANYKNGYADGNWKEVRSYKNRKKYLVYGQYKWEPFEALKTMTISMNFKGGYLAGAVNINDEFAKFTATGNFDKNSLCEGTWMINDMIWNKNRELIYRDNILYEFIIRDNNGSVLEGSGKYQEDYDNLQMIRNASSIAVEDTGLRIDTLCGQDLCAATNNIKEYFTKLLSTDYFLYEFIDGDLTYKEGFKGGCELKVSKQFYTTVRINPKFQSAEDYLSKNELVMAYSTYTKIDISNIKPSERRQIQHKIDSLRPLISSLIELKLKQKQILLEFIRNQSDSLENDAKYFTRTIPLKTTKDENGWKSATNALGVETRLVDSGDSRTKFNFEEPWKNNTLEIAKSCFVRNPEIYSSVQKIVSQMFIEHRDFLANQEKRIKKTEYIVQFDNAYHSLYNIDLDSLFNENLITKRKYQTALNLAELDSKCRKKENDIRILNMIEKRNLLYEKFQMVSVEFQAKLQQTYYSNELLVVLNEYLIFLNAVESSFKQDSKELDKQLKKVETIEQIKQIFLMQ